MANQKFVHVGFDIDGVLRDFLNSCVRHYVEDNPLKKPFFNWPPRADTYGLAGMMRMKDDDVLEDFVQYTFYEPASCFKVYANAEPYPEITNNWNRYYKMLKKLGCKVSFCTLQRNYYQQLATLNWVNEHGFKYDDMILCTENKTGHNFDYFIDDVPKNVIDMSTNGAHAVLFDRFKEAELRNRVKHRVESVEEYVNFVIGEIMEKEEELVNG